MGKKIGLLVGREKDWPEAFMAEINGRDEDIKAELVKLYGTYLSDVCDYTVLIDRISYEIPYYRAFLKFASFQETHIINDPFTWSADDKLVGAALAKRLGLETPRTIMLPNKETTRHDLTQDDFRNLGYPIDWDGIVRRIGVPAILKNAHTGGRHIVHRVNSTDELIELYDTSGDLTMILQEVIEADHNIHCFVIGRKEVLALRYSMKTRRYAPEPLDHNKPLVAFMVESSIKLSKAYRYDINMVEFVVKGVDPYVINSTNPTPFMDKTLMTDEQFDWCVQKTADLAIERAKRPSPQTSARPDIN